jgi:adenylate cyclase
MRTLHPQWGGYSYLWRRDLNAIEPSQFERGTEYRQDWLTSPFAYLVGQARAEGGSGDPWRYLRRHLCGPEALLDFPLLEELAGAGGTDYFAQIVRFGPEGDASRGTGIAYSFTTDHREGFSEDDLTLLRAVLPALSLAMMAHATRSPRASSKPISAAMPGGGSMPEQCSADRSKAFAPCFGTPISAASLRSPTRRPG